MLHDLIMAAGKIAAPLGQSGIFVKPTSILSSGGVFPYAVTSLENAYDSDPNTYGVISCNSDNNQYVASVYAKFKFDAVHPGGKLRIKHKLTMGMYQPGGFWIHYSPNLDGSGPIQLASLSWPNNNATPIIDIFNIPSNIGVVSFSAQGGAKYSSAIDEIYDISLEL